MLFKSSYYVFHLGSKYSHTIKALRLRLCGFIGLLELDAPVEMLVFVIEFSYFSQSEYLIEKVKRHIGKLFV